MGGFIVLSIGWRIARRQAKLLFAGLANLLALSRGFLGCTWDWQRRGGPNRGVILRSHQNRAGAEVGFGRETRRSNLCGIPAAKGERFRRMYVPTTSLVIEVQIVASTHLPVKGAARPLLARSLPVIISISAAAPKAFGTAAFLIGAEASI